MNTNHITTAYEKEFLDRYGNKRKFFVFFNGNTNNGYLIKLVNASMSPSEALLDLSLGDEYKNTLEEAKGYIKNAISRLTK